MVMPPSDMRKIGGSIPSCGTMKFETLQDLLKYLQEHNLDVTLIIDFPNRYFLQGKDIIDKEIIITHQKLDSVDDLLYAVFSHINIKVHLT